MSHPTEGDWQRAREGLVLTLNSLRYSGSVSPISGIDLNDTEAEFLTEITYWLTAFGDVLTGVSATTTDMARQLAELRSQRKAVRDFLGLPNHIEGDTA